MFSRSLLYQSRCRKPKNPAARISRHCSLEIVSLRYAGYAKLQHSLVMLTSPRPLKIAKNHILEPIPGFRIRDLNQPQLNNHHKPYNDERAVLTMAVSPAGGCSCLGTRRDHGLRNLCIKLRMPRNK